jgi:hypothetical protein
MLTTHRVLPLILLTLLALGASPVAVSAQAPFNACTDRLGAPIPSRTNDKMGYAGMAGYENGKPVIWWNKHSLSDAAEVELLFIYMHECAHLSLGHSFRYGGVEDEIEADCWAVQLMVDGEMISQFEFDTLLAIRARVAGDGGHLGGDGHVWSLHRCLSVRTDRVAWAEALPPIVQAGATHFTGIRGRELEAEEGKDSIWESTLDLPGTYDCEVMGTKRLRCMVFLSRSQKPAAARYKKLVDILIRWLPEGWTYVENPSPKPPFSKAFHAQDPTTGETLSLLLGTSPKLYFVVTAPQNP